MPLTSPDDIYYPDSSSTDGFETEMAAVATSVQAALANREVRTFKWADSTERAAQTDMEAGDMGYQVDWKMRWSYDGSAWVPVGGGQLPYAFLTRSTNQSISHLNETTVTFDTIQSVGSGWANSSGVITIPYSGPYLFTLGAMWLANGSATGSVRRLIITRNGTTERILDNHIVATAATADHAMTFTGSRTLTAGDTIRWRVLHNGGVTLNLGPLPSGDLYTRVQYLGPS